MIVLHSQNIFSLFETHVERWKETKREEKNIDHQSKNICRDPIAPLYELHGAWFPEILQVSFSSISSFRATSGLSKLL